MQLLWMTSCYLGKGRDKTAVHSLNRSSDPVPDRSGLRSRGHAQRGRISERRVLQARLRLPLARVQRYFVWQTIDLGGETQKVDADISQFAGSQTANRLVLTIGNVPPLTARM